MPSEDATNWKVAFALAAGDTRISELEATGQYLDQGNTAIRGVAITRAIGTLGEQVGVRRVRVGVAVPNEALSLTQIENDSYVVGEIEVRVALRLDGARTVGPVTASPAKRDRYAYAGVGNMGDLATYAQVVLLDTHPGFVEIFDVVVDMATYARMGGRP